MKFIYKNNKENGKIIMEIEASDILEADKILEQKTKINVLKCPWVGCEIKSI